jgi:hypothetical protein
MAAADHSPLTGTVFVSDEVVVRVGLDAAQDRLANLIRAGMPGRPRRPRLEGRQEQVEGGYPFGAGPGGSVPVEL